MAEATMKKYWAFFEIFPGAKPAPFTEFQPITPDQAVEAIAHGALHGGLIELYLCEEGSYGTPLTGLVFEGGCYTGYGLGEPPTPELLPPLDEPFIMLDDKLVPVKAEVQFMVDYFTSALKE